MSDYQACKIILIEDSTFTRAAICTKLNALGFENVDLPEDSAEGWAMITQSLVDGDPYDLVITDLNMPGLDGIDLIEKMKNDPESRDMKILVISADADQLIIDEVKELGVQDYLTKPVSTDDLASSVKKILN